MDLLKSSAKAPHRHRIIAVTLSVLYISVFFWLNNRQYLSFQVRSPDADRFFQAIWYTLNGRFLFTSITNYSILGSHFTPYFAFLSPLLLFWSDIRVLYLAQLIHISLSGLVLYKLIEPKRQNLAIWLLLAFYLNPTLHQITLFELRRVTFAMPYLSLLLYAVYYDKKRLMLMSIFFLFLIKEDLGLIVSAVGIYLVLVRKDWKWGAPIFVSGFGWSLTMILWVIPAFSPVGYPQMGYFAVWGNSFVEIITNIISNPGEVLAVAFDKISLQAIFQKLLPLGLFLPFLGIEFLAISIPMVGLMLLSNVPEMHSLQRWYMAPILPILFTAVAVGIMRLPQRFSHWSMILLVSLSLLGYRLFSPGPGGMQFEPYRYTLIEKHQQVWEMIHLIPEDAAVAAQGAFIAPIANRENAFIFPWIAIGEENIDYFVFGKGFNSYPLLSHELEPLLNNMLSDKDLTIVAEAENIYLLHQDVPPTNKATPLNAIAEKAILLQEFEIAVADEQGFYQSIGVDGGRLQLKRGDRIRIALYWQAMEKPAKDRTVSTRLLDETGALIAQHDMVPGNGSRPTSWWEPGWEFRDLFYLEVPQDANNGPVSLEVVLYDTWSQEPVPFAGINESAILAEVEIGN